MSDDNAAPTIPAPPVMIVPANTGGTSTETQLALLNMEMKHLREQHKGQSEQTNSNYGKLAEVIKPISEYVIKNADLPAKVAEHEAYIQQQKGFFNLTRWLTGITGGGIGGILVAAVKYYSDHSGK